MQSPLNCFRWQTFSLNMPSQRGYALRCNIDVCICLKYSLVSYVSILVVGEIMTSTVSKTFITPGCRNVRSLRNAFLARGRRDLLATISKENTLHFEPSSYVIWALELSALNRDAHVSFHDVGSILSCRYLLGHQMRKETLVLLRLQKRQLISESPSL